MARAVLLGGVVSACGGGGREPAGPVRVSDTVLLAPGAYAVLAGADVAGALAFPAADAAGAEYLVVGQLATATPDLSSPFVLRGQTPQGAAGSSAQLARAEAPVALRFHHGLRRREAEMARSGAARAGPAPAPGTPPIPPVVGARRTFKVCADLDCSSTRNVPATARFVGTHAAIFLDDSVPSGGFATSDLADLGTQFDRDLYQVAVDHFGAESDIDNNGVVIVLLSKQINALVARPQCNTSFITGFFFGADLAPQFAAQYNNGEIFYGMVPDPGGTASCAYSVSFVKRIIPVTFIHEFQHMINFNQKVLVRGGAGEILWLNEALSHLAEELGGLYYDSLGMDTTASRFLIGNFFNAFDYLRAPGGAPLVTDASPGSLESRGAGWLFVRWLVDQYGPATSRSLVQTPQSGALAAQAAAGGTPFATLVARWSLAVYLSDLPGFTAPPELRYTTWRFRSTFAALNQQDPNNFTRPFPLVPDTGRGASTSVSGTVSSGSGGYALVLQASGGGAFDLFFRRSSTVLLPAQGAPQVAVVRIR